MMTENGQKAPRKLIDLLEYIGKARDGILVSIALIYVLGFVVWSINSLNNNIGFIRAFDAQYFVAGFLPAVLITIIILMLRVIYGATEKLQQWAKQRRWIIFVLSSTVIALYTAMALIIFTDSSEEVKDVAITKFGAMFLFRDLASSFVAVSLCVIFSVLTIFVTIRLKAFQSNLGKIYMMLLVTPLIVLAFLVYVNSIYPKLPQELGGAQPRCAQLDIATEGLSATVQEEIDLDKSQINTNIIRVKNAQIHYYSNDVIIFKLRNNNTEPRSFEIRRDFVNSITWC